MAELPPSLIAADPLLGAEVGGSYVIVRALGIGGMGSIYEAKHTRLPRKFAIKVMLPVGPTDQVAFERFKQEAQAASSLGNAHIVDVVDFNFLPDGAPFMVMEYLEGDDLERRLKDQGKLAPRYAASIIADVASGLAAAHAHGIIHRDVKPANIFLARREREGELVKVLDFGAAKVSTNRLTGVGQTMGTPWYMSPEQARGTDLDPRSDQFSLAVVLYETLTGRVPFEDLNPVEVLRKIVREDAAPIRTHEPSLPAALEPILARALAKKAEDRFSSVEEFAAHAGAVLGAAPARSPAARALTVREVAAESSPGPEAPRAPAAEVAPDHPPSAAESSSPAPLAAEPPAELDSVAERPSREVSRPYGRWALIAALAVGLTVGVTGVVVGVAAELRGAPMAVTPDGSAPPGVPPSQLAASPASTAVPAPVAAPAAVMPTPEGPPTASLPEGFADAGPGPQKPSRAAAKKTPGKASGLVDTL